MPLVSVLILTRNRAQLLEAALRSISRQTLRDFEIVLVNDGSTDETASVIDAFGHLNLHVIHHAASAGITKSRQEALEASRGEFIAVLDDDDEWADEKKLEKQVGYLRSHPNAVLVGGGRLLQKPGHTSEDNLNAIFRPERDASIRKTMLLRNNFFTSTVLFRRSAAMAAGGFIFDGTDVTEDYDLWLRLGKQGAMYNFPEPLDIYRVPNYTTENFKRFLRKQLSLIDRHREDYPYYWLSRLILKCRIAVGV